VPIGGYFRGPVCCRRTAMSHSWSGSAGRHNYERQGLVIKSPGRRPARTWGRRFVVAIGFCVSPSI